MRVGGRRRPPNPHEYNGSPPIVVALDSADDDRDGGTRGVVTA
jgi:hypothetical protein